MTIPRLSLIHIFAPSEVEAFADEIAGYPGLRLRGLMAIPAPAADSESRRRPLAAMRALFERLRVKHPGMDTLSMGTVSYTHLDVYKRQDHALERAGSAELDFKAHHEVERKEEVVGAVHR